MEEKKTDSVGGAKFIPPVRPPSLFKPPVPKPATPAMPLPQQTGAAPSASAKTAADAAHSGDLNIQTMQEDIAALNRVGSLPITPLRSANSGATRGEAPLPPGKSTQSAKGFPLPPKAPSKQQKVVVTPAVKERPRWLIWVSLAITVIFFIGALSGGVWYWLSKNTSTIAPEHVADTAAIISAKADLVIGYTVSSEQDRLSITSLWVRKGQPPSLAALMQGDPRLLLSETGPDRFFYVALSGDPRPYLLVPQTEAVEAIITNTPDAAVTAYQGWYVAHQIDPQPYIESLKTGTLTGTKQSDLLKQVSETNALSALVRSGPLQSFRSTLGGKQSTKGSWQAIALGLQPSATNQALAFTGLAEIATAAETSTQPSAATSSSTSASLLETLPADVTAVHIGSNFEQDITTWQKSGGPIRSDIVAQSSVDQLLKTLDVPYAWYTRNGADNVADSGLILDLNSLSNPLTLAQPGIEQGLSAFVAVVMEQPLTTPVAFTDGTYGDVPLRFVNILGSTIALDYALVNNHLLIASSKEGMFALIDTVSKRTPSALTSLNWKTLFTEWGTVPASTDIVFGSFSQPIIQKLLPVSAPDKALQVAATITTVNQSPEIEGFILY